MKLINKEGLDYTRRLYWMRVKGNKKWVPVFAWAEDNPAWNLHRDDDRIFFYKKITIHFSSPIKKDMEFFGPLPDPPDV